MISVIIPFWQRQAELDASLARFDEFYGGDPIEIIVVDDGSPVPARADTARVVRLASKSEALNPCVPLNVGVGLARYDVIVLTNPEVVHRQPILSAMLDELEAIGDKGYVAAACWQGKEAYCHSTRHHAGTVKLPEGAGLHFCAMLNRSLFQNVGGFSEKYREGQGYEDADFLWKLHADGARFKIRDDLVTDHLRCARTEWPKGGLERNRRIFENQWHD